MKVNVKDLLEKCGLAEAETMYPGKRIVKKCPQNGTFKSHSAVFDWRMPDMLRIDIKAGLTGKDMEPADLRHYPISFQSPTFVEISTEMDDSSDTEEDGGEEESGAQGSQGGGGKGKAPQKKKQDNRSAFSRVVEGRIPDVGNIQRLVVMGKDIAQEAFRAVLDMLAAQIKALTVTPVNIVAAAHAVDVSVAEPSGGLRPKGHETVAYRYKGAEMFGLENPVLKKGRSAGPA